MGYEKARNEQTRKTNNSDTDNSMALREGRGWMSGVEYMVTEDGLTVGGGHTVQYTDHVS